MPLREPHRPPLTDRQRRNHRRARQATAPLSVPLLNGTPGEPVNLSHTVRNDLPHGFEPPGPPSHDPRYDRPGRRSWLRRGRRGGGWPFGASHGGGGWGGWPPLPDSFGLGLPDWRGGLPWWLKRLAPLLAAAGVLGLLHQWLLTVALVGVAVAAALHHYRIGVYVDSRTVRILYPVALIVACLTFASSPLWTRHLQPIAANVAQAAAQAIDRARHPTPEAGPAAEDTGSGTRRGTSGKTGKRGQPAQDPQQDQGQEQGREQGREGDTRQP